MKIATAMCHPLAPSWLIEKAFANAGNAFNAMLLVRTWKALVPLRSWIQSMSWLPASEQVGSLR